MNFDLCCFGVETSWWFKVLGGLLLVLCFLLCLLIVDFVWFGLWLLLLVALLFNCDLFAGY